MSVDGLQKATSRARETWRPILTRDTAARAREIIDAIGDALKDPPAGSPADGSLAEGFAGFALFHAYASLAGSGVDSADRAMAFLERSIDGLSPRRMSPSLYSGFAGPAWVVAHLAGRLYDPADEDVTASIDDALDGGLAGSDTFLSQFDLISGMVGLGVYALERTPSPWSRSYLERIVAGLDALAKRTPGGVAWWSDPESLPQNARERLPRGCYNLGVAHGLPGVIAFLAYVLAQGIAEEITRGLLRDAMRWLLIHKLPAGSKSEFPAWVADDDSPPANRISWCYGNPGIAVALLAAARHAGEPAWERDAVEQGLGCAARDPEASGVVDACLCHGSAGNAHLFNRLYQATGEARFRQASRYWFGRTIDYHQPGSGVAGYRNWGTLSESEEETGWTDNPGFLNGAAGIGLALLAATSSVEPRWDRLLLAAVPPRAT